MQFQRQQHSPTAPDPLGSAPAQGVAVSAQGAGGAS